MYTLEEVTPKAAHRCLATRTWDAADGVTDNRSSRGRSLMRYRLNFLMVYPASTLVVEAQHKEYYILHN